MAIALQDHLCFHLYAASRLIIQGFDAQFAPMGLTYLKYLALCVLVENGGQSVLAVGHQLKLDSGTLSPLLRSLETQRLIVRKRTGADQRVVLNFVTERGRKLHGEAQEVAYQMFCQTGLTNDGFLKLRADVKEFVTRCESMVLKSKGQASLVMGKQLANRRGINRAHAN
jgi:MarR family transcriptional regulator, organic hydroperoxide resistance regulator